MQPMSEAFRRTIMRPHTIATRCEVVSPTFQVLKVLQPINGNVSVSAEDTVGRSCTASLIDYNGTLTPLEAADLLSPLSGNMLRMYRGVVLPNGDKELKAQGVFDIEDADIMDPGEHVRIDFRGFDFSKRISANTFQTPYTVAAGTRFDLAIRDMLATRMPNISFNFETVTYVTPQLTFDVGDDPWEKAKEMAASIGYDLWFDVVGFCRLKAQVDPTSEPVWEYSEGEYANLLYVNKRIRREDVFNQVYTRSTNTSLDEPIVGFAEDDNPNSPTRVNRLGGVLGDRPTELSSEYIATQSQADQLAVARLRQTMGMPQSMHIISIVNPAHEENDIVRIRRARIGVDSNYVMTGFNINLHPWQGMNASMREVRV